MRVGALCSMYLLPRIAGGRGQTLRTGAYLRRLLCLNANFGDGVYPRTNCWPALSQISPRASCWTMTSEYRCRGPMAEWYAGLHSPAPRGNELVSQAHILWVSIPVSALCFCTSSFQPRHVVSSHISAQFRTYVAQNRSAAGGISSSLVWVAMRFQVLHFLETCPNV